MEKMNDIEIQAMRNIIEALNEIKECYTQHIKCNVYYDKEGNVEALEYVSDNRYVYKVMQDTSLARVMEMYKKHSLFLKIEALSDEDWLSLSIEIPYGNFGIELVYSK